MNLTQRYQHLTHWLTQQSPHAQLLAVSKTKPITDIQTLVDLGHRAFGENYLQEAIEKIQHFAHIPDMQWHFIGGIQANKTKDIARYFDWVQTVDRAKIAQRLNDHRALHHQSPLNLLIQINANNEPQKSGVAWDEVDDLATHITALPHLNLRGLMAIPDPHQTDQQLQSTFHRLHQQWQQLQHQYPQIDTLSMGMSGDKTLALMEGSTMIRIGTELFGSRDPENFIKTLPQ